MAKTTKKRGEKLGDIVGRRRPVLGSVFIFAGLILLISILNYVPGQEVFFKPYFESFMSSTESAGANWCGRLGATFCLLGYRSIGAAVYMIPVYLIWSGLLCFQRRASAFTKAEISAILGGLFLLSVFASVFQVLVGFDTTSQMHKFPSGWGGKLGFVVFEHGLRPFLEVFGSAMLVGVLYAFCLTVVFVDSPIEAAKELGGLARKSPSVFLRVAKIFWVVLAFPFKLIFRRRKKDDEDDEGGAEPSSRIKISLHTPMPEAVDTAEIAETVPVVELPPEEPPQQPSSAAVSEIDDVVNSILDNAAAASVDKPINDFSDRFPEEEAETAKEEESASEQEEPDEAQGDEDVKKSSPSAEPARAPAEFKVETFKPEKYVPPEPPKRKGDFIFPSLDLLSNPPESETSELENHKERIMEIVRQIGNFGIKVEPAGASQGPVITRYEVRPAPGVRVAKIAGLENDIAIGIKAQKVRVIAPIPGTGTVGIEVPNMHRQSVCLRSIIESKEWNESKAKIPVALGKDVTGKCIVLDLTKMPHALIAGSTGSGKSVCMNSIIASLVYKMAPEDLRFIMVDPKVVELQVYNSLPHMLVPVVTNPKKVPGALKWLIDEMMRRYKIFSAVSVKNIAGFNAKIVKDAEEAKQAEELDAQLNASLTPEERTAALDAASDVSDDSDEIEIPETKLPYIVCIIDELADLMMVAGKEVEAYIARLTQLARAAGIHLLVATQRPSTDVITGLIKANLPTRIAFKTASNVDSRTILDSKGAETLIGLGDMLFVSAGSADLIRAQGAFTSDEEVSSIVEALKVNGEPEFAEDVQSQIDSSVEEDEFDGDGEAGDYDDPMVAKAIGVIRANKKASTSLLQRKLKIGYGRAARIIDELEEKNIIGPDDGSGKREIFLD